MGNPLEDAKALFRRDPVVGYVAIGVASARAPNPGEIVDLGGHSVRLPKWGIEEWGWYTRLAVAMAASVEPFFAPPGGADAVKRAKARVLETGKRVSAGDLSPAAVGDLYLANNRLLLAAVGSQFAARDAGSAADALVQVFGQALKEVPQTIASALGAAGDAAAPIVEASAKIVTRVLGAAVKGAFSGSPFLIVALVVGAYLIFGKKRGGSSHGETA